MREMNWPPARRAEGTLILGPRLQARALAGWGSTLISGDVEAAVTALAPGAPILGLFALVPEGAHALRIARDRALLVNPQPLGAADGWREGWCATSVDDGWQRSSRWPQRAACVGSGASADLTAYSPSAAGSSPGYAACSRGRKRASGFMSRRPGSRRCWPGWTAREATPAEPPCHTDRACRICVNGDIPVQSEQTCADEE